MSEAKIFLLDDSGENVSKMVEVPYEAEEVLQRLLVIEPELLPGDQINPENPRDWLLVKQEMGIPGEMDEGDRWSLDHLFLDQDAIPTFVECKRASDTRSRREVVAQMLDYAANGIAHWPVDRLRQAAAETPRKNGSLDDAILKLVKKEGISEEEKIEEIANYWRLVEANLHAGKIRLIFVADDIPKELRRLVEFLNEKMADVEVLAVEIKQFVDKKGKEKRKAVVPRVIGLVKSPPPSPSPHIDRERFLAKCTPEARSYFARVLDSAEVLAQSGKYSIYWGKLSFSIRAYLANKNGYVSFIYGEFPDHFEVFLGYLPLSKQERVTWSDELLNSGIFLLRGASTFRTTLKGGNLNRIQEVYNFILKKVDEIIERSKMSEEASQSERGE